MAGQVAASVDAHLVTERASILGLHSPINFLREIPLETQQARYGTGAAMRFGTKTDEQIVPMTGSAGGQWLLQYLPWDTEFFGTNTYRLFTGLFASNTDQNALTQAAAALRDELAARERYYAFSVVPAEDIALLQALSSSGWRLVETRLNFYRSTATPLPTPPFPVRLATFDEATHIGQISATARNEFDRFHADPWFGEARAGAMLARYAEAAVAGTYADAVLVPAENNLPVDSFLAIGDIVADPQVLNSGVSRVLLTAVGPQNRGWHLKLVSEAVRRAAAQNLSYVLMTTQATNRAVFRTCEKLGFQLGSTTHVLACSNS
jgi:dTDP-4-amino-4,6-dideoxy-D-galactose acyltransferase